jgi:uncharacterized protein YqhQ
MLAVPLRLMNETFSYGGQAVIEGVMMRGRNTMAVSVRKPDGTIQTEVKPLGGIYQSRIAKIPILRGVLLLADTVGLGWESLEFSARAQGEKPVSKGEWFLTILISLAILVGVFFLLPTILGQWTESGLGALAVQRPSIPAWVPGLAGNLTEGVVRLILLILYLVFVGRIPEITRVFAYHGAEHKTVHAFEAGADLTPEAVEAFAKEHPRCGTSFLVVVGVLAVLLFALAGPMPFYWKLITRLLGIPVLIALGYEYLRLSARVQNPALARILAAPGVWAQSLTTRNPDRSMLEVAITAFQAVRRADDPQVEAAAAEETTPEIPAAGHPENDELS